MSKNKSNPKLEDSVSYWTMHVSKVASAVFTPQFRRLGLTVTAFQALSVLAENEGITVSELSDLTFIDQPTLTKILSRLEEEGYIRREAAARDKRLVQNYITVPGLKLLPGMWRVVFECEERMLRGFNDEELTNLRDYLSRMDHNLAGR